MSRFRQPIRSGVSPAFRPPRPRSLGWELRMALREGLAKRIAYLEVLIANDTDGFAIG